MEAACFPPSRYRHGGEEGLGNVQTGPCIVGAVQPVEPSVKRGGPTGRYLFLDVGMEPQTDFSWAKEEGKIGKPTRQGDELDRDQQFSSTGIVPWSAKGEGDIESEYGVVHQDAPVDEGYGVV